MSDSNMDISKIVGLIMQNPEIIEKIRSLAELDSGRSAVEPTAKVDTGATSEQNEADTEVSASTEEEAASAAAIRLNPSRHRHDLLCALKPYVSKKRASAIDTALGIMEVIAVMKG